MKRYEFVEEALVEYEEAISYYEQASPGLGSSFVLYVERSLAFMLDFPEMGPLVADVPAELGVRRRLIRRFGVELVYRISDEVVVVLALFHGKRRPGYWKGRLNAPR